MQNNASDFYIDRYGKFILKPEHITSSPRHSAHAVCIHNHALLLSRPADNPIWELPGGGIEDEESVSNTLIREIYEETGLILSDAPTVKLIYSQNIKYYADERQLFWDYSMGFYALESEWDIRKDQWLAPGAGCIVQWAAISQLHEFPICSSHFPAILLGICHFSLVG